MTRCAKGEHLTIQLVLFVCYSPKLHFFEYASLTSKTSYYVFVCTSSLQRRIIIRDYGKQLFNSWKSVSPKLSPVESSIFHMLMSMIGWKYYGKLLRIYNYATVTNHTNLRKRSLRKNRLLLSLSTLVEWRSCWFSLLHFNLANHISVQHLLYTFLCGTNISVNLERLGLKYTKLMSAEFTRYFILFLFCELRILVHEKCMNYPFKPFIIRHLWLS